MSFDSRVTNRESVKVPRVLFVVQPSASHYRAPLIRQLVDSKLYEFVLLGKHSASARKVQDRVIDAEADLISQVRPIHDVDLYGNFKWQRGVVSGVIRERADIYVFEGSPYNLSTWFAIALARLRGGTALLWGHGWKRPDGPRKLAARKLFYRCVSGHLLYGDWARRYAQQVGLDPERFFPVYNSIYPESVIQELSRDRVSIDHSRERGQPLSIVFSGRLTPRHEVSMAVDAVIRLFDEGLPIRLTVIGDGSEKAQLESYAEQHQSLIRFLGPIYDQDRLVSEYQKCDFAISPGASGLNVIQALGFGVPVIASKGNYDSGPEIEAVIDGETGLVFEDGSITSLMTAIRRANEMTHSDYSNLVAVGQELVLKKYTAERHAGAILAALAAFGRPRSPDGD